MCGIAGVIAKTIKGEEKLNKLESGLQLLKHRGPDVQQCVRINNSVGLAHARLSIIDLSESANQPFSTDNENFLVFNGEIFNYESLKQTKYPGNYKTCSDTELVYYALQEDNLTALNEFSGFYAFAFYNKTNHSMLMAVDRLGVKPLYYLDDENYFAFASEASFLISLQEKLTINKEAILPYLCLTYQPGEQTLLKNVKRLLPGTYIKINNGTLSFGRHYVLKAQKKSTENFRVLFEDAVKLRLVSDVSVGSFLSGGIDSTIVSGLAAKFNPGINTFSLGFKGNAFLSETNLAKRTADKLKTNHHELEISEEDLINKIDSFLNHLDLPFADSSALNVFVLSEYASKMVKVVLSGDGADEVFGGYNKYRAWQYLHGNKSLSFAMKMFSPIFKNLKGARDTKIGNLIRKTKKYHEISNLSDQDLYWNLLMWTPKEQAESLLLSECKKLDYYNALKRNYVREIKSDVNSVMFTDTQFVLPFDMLVKVDRMSMAHGLEIRSPFMDYRVIEFGLGLNVNEKIVGKKQKYFLRKEFSDLIPDFIAQQPKRGFEIPIEKWLKGPLRKRVETEWLNDDLIATQGIFDRVQIKKLINQLNDKHSGEGVYTIWTLLIFNHWWKRNFL